MHTAEKHDAINSLPSLQGKRLETETDITAEITKSCSEDTKRTGMYMRHTVAVSVCCSCILIVKHCIGWYLQYSKLTK